ncbi:MAG: DUF3524 domain-containing protein [Planctomycetota bacterium]
MHASSLDVLFLEPWWGGSHRAFVETWSQRSRHRFDSIGLSPHHWKWRQEASAWELARRVRDRPAPDVLACSDFVDLPRLLGFLPPAWRAAPTLCYFHENQLTYPGAKDARDLTHGFSNVLSAVRADACAFNSEFHRAEFRDAADAFLARLPRPNPRAELATALDGAPVVAPLPEIEAGPLGLGGDGPLRIAFPHRLEPDKDPTAFFEAARAASARGAEIELVLVGGHPGSARDDIRAALVTVDSLMATAGFVESRAEYLELLGTCDVVASTAHHEFFGVAFAEALAAGCAPLALDRANYPALVAPYAGPGGIAADVPEFVERLVRLADDPRAARHAMARTAARASVLEHDAARGVPRLDAIAEDLVRPSPPSP